MDHVEFMAVFCNILQGVGFDKVEGIPRLGPVIHTNDLVDPGSVISHGCTTGPAE